MVSAFYATQLPLRVLHARAHGLPTEAMDFELAEKSRALFDSERDEEPAYDEVSFERSSCLGQCPVDSVRLLKDGQAIYWGEENVEKLGCYRARAPKEAFLVLSETLEEIRFWKMDDTYAVLETDAPSTYTAARLGEERKVVWNYANSAPVELWLFEEFLLGVVKVLDWQPWKEKSAAADCLGYAE